MLKHRRIGWSGCHGDYRASWDPACHLASGPLYSRDLSVKEENLPLKICRLSGASLYPQPKLQPPRLNPLGSQHLHLPYPSMCSLSFLSMPPFLQWLVPLNPVSTVPPNYFHILSLSLPQAMQAQIWTWKKENHKKSLVSLLQTK